MDTYKELETAEQFADFEASFKTAQGPYCISQRANVFVFWKDILPKSLPYVSVRMGDMLFRTVVA